MSSRKSSDERELPQSLRLHSKKLAVWRIRPSTTFAQTNSEVSNFKRRTGSSSSSTTGMEVSLSEETCDSLSDEDEPASFLDSVPKLSLPTLYEDEENPITVKIHCRKCVDMEKILRTFTEIHVKAFATCKEKKDQFWEYLINWNATLHKSLERIKSHLIGEFLTHIEQAPLSEFKEEHDFRVQFNHYRLLFTHMKSMEDRLAHRRIEIECPLKENYNIDSTDKVVKDLHTKITSARLVLQQLEQRIRCIACSWDSARAATNQHGFRQAIFTKEDYIFNRLSNIFTCIDFLEKERKFYEEKAHEVCIARKKKFLPILQIKSKFEANEGPKPCNVKRRLPNSLKRKLPTAIAHLYPFMNSEVMDDIHASWYRTFLVPEDLHKEVTKQRETNTRVLSDINQLKKEIHHLETQLKMKEYVDQTVKNEEEDITMFPEKFRNSSSFLDFNALF